jgi:hypothetical protein
LRAHYEHVPAYHHDNYRSLLWRFFRPYRAALFRLSPLLVFRCATQNQSLIEAFQYIQRTQHTTPTQTTLTIDAEGVPHLKRLKA